jgi:hypothetical protein
MPLSVINPATFRLVSIVIYMLFVKYFDELEFENSLLENDLM